MQRTRTLYGVIFCTGLAAVAALAGRTSDDAERLLSEGRDLAASMKPQEALAVFERVPGDVRTDEAAKEAAVLRVLCLVRSGKPDDAAKAATDLLSAWPPEEPWRGRVEGLLATAADAKGDFKTAAVREEALATRLLSDAERARLAEVYFSWARRFAEGSRTPNAEPDRARAVEAYRFGIAALGDDAPRAARRLEMARQLLLLGDGDAAAGEAEAALTEAPKKKDGEEAKPSPAWVAEARLLVAEGRFAAGNMAAARAALRAFFQLPSVDEAGYSARATLLMGRTYVGDPAVGSADLADEFFAAYLSRWPDGKDAASARRLRAEARLAVGAPEAALPHLSAMLEANGTSEEDLAWARVRRFEALRDLKRYDAARDAVRDYLARHPAHALVPSAQAALPALLTRKAAELLAEKKTDEAIEAMREFVATYPLDGSAPDKSIAIGDVLAAAERLSSARDAYRDAREVWRRARPDVAARAGFLQGRIEERLPNGLEAAAETYAAVAKEFPKEEGGSLAARRRVELEAIELSLATPRIFAPNEAAHVVLSVRNVAETTFRIYRLDAPGYFERKGTLEGAEALDVALVKADRSWTFKTPNYARYRADEIEAPLALGDGGLREGAYLVSAEADRRRAVVLAIVSKIRVVVKQAPTEVFAWALDATTMEPIKGVDVSVRGSSFKASATTDADGVARVPFAAHDGPCRVLARLGASAVPGEAVVPGAPTREKLEPRAHWTFDRPIYRAGDEVRFAAVLRDVDAGAFTTPFEAKVDVSWVDPQGRVFRSTTIEAERFGKIHGAFRLPAEGALGDWSLRASFKRKDGVERFYSTTVVVAEYRKPDYVVEATPKKATARPGARLDFDLTITALFGGPAADVGFTWRAYRKDATFDEARYREQAWIYRAREAERAPTPDAEWTFVAEGGGVADAEGRASVGFDSVDLATPQRYLLQATVVDATKARSSGSGYAYASWTPGNVVVLPDRKAYRAGDRITARVLAVDWGGAPLSARGKAEVLLVRNEGGRVVEERLATADVDLGSDGEAETTLEAPKSGRVFVRFTGEDAQGLKVAGEASAKVAGERPDLAKEAKIVFEKEFYRAGEKARAFVDVPEAPTTGLLTFEAESVLLHRVVRLRERSSVVEIELPELLAPNCTATWTNVRGDRLLTSEDPIVVLRHLDVKVTPSKGEARPGETVKLRVEVRDQAGRPAEATVALGLADSALDGLGGFEAQDPRFTFLRDVRAHLVRTGSSFAFARRAIAAPLDEDLVALGEESDRLSSAKRFQEEFRRDRDRFAASKAKPGEPGAPPVADAEMGFGGGSGGSYGGRAGGRRTLRAAGGGGATTGGGSDKKSQESEKHDAGPFEDSARLKDARVDFDVDLTLAAEPNEQAERLRKALGDDQYKSPGLGSVNTATGSFAGAVFDGVDVQQGVAIRSLFAPAQPEVEPRRDLRDVAAWAPSLTTGADGVVEIDATLPDNLTIWSATATAVGAEVAAGYASAKVRARKDVFVRLATPPYANAGDRFDALVVGVRSSNAKAKLALSLKTDDPRVGALQGSTSIEKDDVPGAAFDVRVVAARAGVVKLEASVVGPDGSDALQKSIPVRPFGEPWRVVERRDLRDATSIAFEIPEDAAVEATRAVVVVRAGLESDLLEGLAFLRSWPHATLDAIVDRVVAAAVVRRARLFAGAPPLVDEDDLRRATADLYTTMRSYQNADGGFSTWPKKESEPEPTAHALRGLALLRDLGRPAEGDLFAAATLGAVAALKNPGATPDQRAALVEALARAGAPPIEEIDALTRGRDGLSSASLARLVVAAAMSRRGPTVDGLLATLRSRRVESGGLVSFEAETGRARLGDREETLALALLAYQETNARVDEQNELVRSLAARRRAFGCVAPRPAATTALALARHMTGTGALDVSGPVTATLDGASLGSKTLDGANPIATFELDSKALLPGRRELRFSRSGGGEVDVRLVAYGVIPKESVAATDDFFSIDRRVVAYVDPDARASAFAEGYSIVVVGRRPPYEPPPSIKKIVSGTKATTRLVLRARGDASNVVVEDPLPAGVEPIESGVRGPFSRFERRGDRMVFYFDHLPKGRDVVVTYPTHAANPGAFRAGPPEAYDMYAPETRGRGASLALEIVPDPALMERLEPPKPTPDSRFFAAKKAFTDKDYAATLEALGDLAETQALVDDVLDAVLDMTRRSALRLGRHEVGVKAHDALARRNPAFATLDLSDDRLFGVSLAALGEFERARDRFRRVVDDSFVRGDAALVRFLQEFVGSEEARFAEAEALKRRPVRGPAADAALAHAGGWLHVADPKVDRTASAVRRSRWARALVDYQRVMAWLPGSAAAERASFERAATYGDLGLPERVRDEARAIVARFPESDRLDEALAAEAQASFALGNYAEAAPPATRLRNELFPPKGDKKAKSAFAESAAYLLGRIAHVEGRLQDAVALYGEAAPRVPEAGQAYAFFTRKLLATDAVVRVRPGGAAEIPVRVMNVAKASVALYPVDLGVLFATRKSFDALNRADLSGIAPTLAFDFETGVAPYVEGTARIAIEGGLKTGAYLAVVGDGERTATAVVLSSDLDVHVQRGDGDLVRCYVVDVNGKPAAGAKIATGRGGSVRLGGVADERGMLHVDVPGSGKITVVAELGDRYAAAEL